MYFFEMDGVIGMNRHTLGFIVGFFLLDSVEGLCARGDEASRVSLRPKKRVNYSELSGSSSKEE